MFFSFPYFFLNFCVNFTAFKNNFFKKVISRLWEIGEKIKELLIKEELLNEKFFSFLRKIKKFFVNFREIFFINFWKGLIIIW